MPVTASSVDELFVGAGDLYIDGAIAGATEADNVFRITREWFTPNLNGVRGPLKATDYVTSETAELEVTLPEISAANLALMVPGITTTTTNADGTLSGGENTTLAALASVGDTNIKATAVAATAIGDILQIGPSGPTREFRKVTAVGTAGGAGTGHTLDAPLSYAHANGEVLQEVVATTIAQDAAVGATTLKLTSVAGLVVGTYLLFGYSGNRESRRLTAVGTAGAGGTGVQFAQALTKQARTGDPAITTTNEGTTVITSDTSRRIAAAAYHDYELRVPGLGGREVRFALDDALMTSNPEFTANDDANLAPRLVLQARWDAAAPSVAPWRITRVGATA